MAPMLQFMGSSRLLSNLEDHMNGNIGAIYHIRLESEEHTLIVRSFQGSLMQPLSGLWKGVYVPYTLLRIGWDMVYSPDFMVRLVFNEEMAAILSFWPGVKGAPVVEKAAGGGLQPAVPQITWHLKRRGSSHGKCLQGQQPQESLPQKTTASGYHDHALNGIQNQTPQALDTCTQSL